MLDIEKYGNFKPIGKQKKKKQIILCHTSREVGEYLTSLELRYNTKFDKIPNYVISRNGTVKQLLANNSHTNFFLQENINRNSIIITLENLGWLEKKPLTNHYINWKGSIYKEQVFEKKWRDYFFWEPYTKTQIEKTVELCKNIFSEMSINPQFIGHNTKINGIEKYEGVVSRSNFDTNYTDVNPSFDFEYFLNELENEEYT